MGQTRRRAGGRRHGLILQWTEAALEAHFAQPDFIAPDKPTAAIDMDGRIEMFRFLRGAQQWPVKKP